MTNRRNKSVLIFAIAVQGWILICCRHYGYAECMARIRLKEGSNMKSGRGMPKLNVSGRFRESMCIWSIMFVLVLTSHWLDCFTGSA